MKKISRLIMSFGWLLAIVFGYMFFKADLSIQPVKSSVLHDKEPRTPVYLISYADGNEVFYKNQHALAYSAQNKGFDVFYNYRRCLLDKDFVEKYQDILSVKTGAGLWLWKPQILLQTMRVAPENALIVYTDVGYVYVREAFNIGEILGDNDVLLMDLDTYHTKEKLTEWMPKKISEEWGLLDPKSPHVKFIDSGLIVVRNTKNAQDFIEKWLEICARREYAFLKYDKDDIKGFTYDQSLLSLIAHKHGKRVKIIPKETAKVLTVFHHRHAGNNKPVLPLQVLPAKKIREWIGTIFPSFFLKFGF